MEKQKSKFGNWLKTSITARMLVVGILILVLLIPLSFVQDLINERSKRQEEVITEINNKWGNDILLSGPILKIPYIYYTEETHYNKTTKEQDIEKVKHEEAIFILPENLAINSNVDAKALERSIYKSVVFTTDLTVGGNFTLPDLAKEDITEDQLQWEKASLILKTSNLKGIRNQVEIKLGEKEKLSLLPKYNKAYLKTLQSNTLNVIDLKEKTIPFQFNLQINGSESLKFIPVGKSTTANMQSNWASPSFDGHFLPEDGSREISENGFKASWKILQINRQFEQLFIKKLPNLNEFAFGTNFIIPVDEYQKNERTAKYGFLVIGLTLLVFLLIQIVSKIYIHPFQYLMIGLALVMFYTLLLSISEHSSFLKAYLIAGTAVVLLIGIYARFIFKNIKFPLLIFISLTAIYGFIYVIIQLENYALLIGSIGLFLILASVMFASRKIDWNNEQ
ncbi:cell envelope integrity protein CreD [Mesonia aquimarina]|uniref:cell envelope integrity protein CreD n=1 Tax=Mesonia aquimarina TaxID=1504967 RepID=UPI000EF5E049|nr:cell envelope integrity protein CreD [Mesonia aquimarina]